MDLLDGAKLVTKDGETTFDKGSLPDIVCFYFSAHWCPPCRAFTPELAEIYTSVNGDGKQFEVIFVTSDRDESSWKEYYDSMPWLSLPFGDDKIKELKGHFDVTGIPKLVVLKSDGTEITRDGRMTVIEHASGCVEQWKNA